MAFGIVIQETGSLYSALFWPVNRIKITFSRYRFFLPLLIQIIFALANSENNYHFTQLISYFVFQICLAFATLFSSVLSEYLTIANLITIKLFHGVLWSYHVVKRLAIRSILLVLSNQLVKYENKPTLQLYSAYKSHY